MIGDRAIRGGLYALLQEIPGVGVVQKYERFAINDDTFLSFFQDPATKKIMGWEITRSAVPTVLWLGRRCKLTHHYKIKGYYGLLDSAATEISFNEIVDAVLLKFISKKVSGTEAFPLPTVGVSDARFFGEVLCHYAEINLMISEVLAPVSDEVISDLLSMGVNYYLKPGDDVADASDELTFNQP